MLLTDKTALEKANEIIRKSIKNTTIPKWFWVHAEEEKDDIFCYFVLKEGGQTPWPPGVLTPLFKRNGEITDFKFLPPA